VNDPLIVHRSENYPRHLQCMFLCLEVVLGLKINLAMLESALVGNVDNVEGLAHILRCKVSSLLIKYPGLPLGASFKAKSI
jgi:hypothetical protein